MLANPDILPVLERLRMMPLQGVLLVGSEGIGLNNIATFLAGGRHTYAILPENSKKEIDLSGTISVEKIREIYNQAKTSHANGRVFIIQHAHKTTVSAQNALLKLLEEPNSSTHFILLTHQPSTLLPTVLSRLQTITIPRITHEQSLALVVQQGSALSESEKKQVLFLASGRDELLLQLLTDSELRQKTIAKMTDARSFLTTATQYDKLKIALSYVKSRADLIEFCNNVALLIAKTITNNPDKSMLLLAAKIAVCRQALEQNANPKLQALLLVVQ